MKSKIVAGLIGATFFANPASAHHAFTFEFDIGKPIHLSGVLTEVEFINPHTWLHVTVKGEDGATKDWVIEAASPNGLLRRGITKLSIPIGT